MVKQIKYLRLARQCVCPWTVCQRNDSKESERQC